MKTLMILLATLINVSVASAQHDHPSVHGMLIVGSEKVYLSHLPMFHSPHDYQVIFEATFSKEAFKIYQESLATSADEIYTLVPETFVLPEMAHNPKPFTAQIFKGHFERGGKKIATTTVEVKTLFFKKFDPTIKKPATAGFILFGNKAEQFMAHTIFSKPDFDQIVSIEMETPLTNALDAGTVLFGGTTLPNEPIKAKTSATFQIEDFGSSVLVKKVIYTEFGDLSH